jgi:DNA-binding transcriptional MocR family regulator
MWRARRGPLYHRLGDALADGIAQGLLDPGVRLPSERTLAARLCVSRVTVVAAYELLRARGLAERRQGSGTFVAALPAGAQTAAAVYRAPILSRLMDPDQPPVDLAIGAPQLEPSELPELSCSLADAARLAPRHGYDPLGLLALRAAVARYLRTRGVPTTTEEVVITAGAQGGLTLLASALLSPGDRVLVEAPTYPGAIEAFSRAGARVETVERDHAGPLPDRLERALASGGARMLYLVPTCHNPTGAVMSEARRGEVVRLARRAGVRVIEDTVLEECLFDGERPPPLAGMDPERVVSVGSLSKSVWGGLRVGWVRASAPLVLRLGRVRAAADLGSSVTSQALARMALERIDELAAERRELARERLGVLTHELREQLPDFSFAPPRGGWSVWVSLPAGSGDDLAQLAMREGVAISSGLSAAPDDRFAGWVRLCAGPPAPVLREGVTRLARAWQAMRELPAGARERPALPV